MDALDPALFIGSSTEGSPIARALQAELDHQCEPTLWSQGVFEPSGTTIGDLLAAAESSDFAALVLTPDDAIVTRGQNANIARDNVIFELGLFLGALGPRRVFIVQPRDQGLRLPSDLPGVTVLKYRPNRSDRNLQAAIGPAATTIQNRILTEGLRKDRSSSDARDRLAPGISIASRNDSGRRAEGIGSRVGRHRKICHRSGVVSKDAFEHGISPSRQEWPTILLPNRVSGRNSRQAAVISPATKNRGLRPSQMVLKPVNQEYN